MNGRNRQIEMFVVLMSLSICAYGDALENLKSGFEGAMAKAEAEHAARLKGYQGKYVQALEKVLAGARAAGDLQQVITLQAEITRFKEQGSVEPSADIPALAKTTESYKEALARLDRSRDAKTAPYLGSYLKRLEELQKRLVQQDAIQAAVAVKAELALRKTEYAALRARLLASKPKKKTTKPPPVAPAAKPRGESTWISKRGRYTPSSTLNPYSPLDTLLEGEGRLHLETAEPFSFHTQNEENPYIIIDLRKTKTISGFFIANRAGWTKSRARTLTAWVSDDKKSFPEDPIWEAERGQEEWTVELKQAVRARYLKLGLVDENQPLHLKYVKVFGWEK